jgi:anthranilate phosphoribosyltransferase
VTDFKDILALLGRGEILNAAQMRAAMEMILAGEVSPPALGGFLVALKMRGETVGEIAEAAKVMGQFAERISGGEDALDTCGTGGDGANTYNISTAVAFVTAACGVKIAKHGNKAVSSASGSSDVLRQLGVTLEAPMNVVTRGLLEDGIAFLFAPNHHPAMRHVAPVRAELGMRTMFNLLGPLSNPAGARRQLLGVYDKKLCRVMAETLRALGSEAAWVVHGADGLDELTLCGSTHVCALEANGEIKSFEVTPEDAGLTRVAPSQLQGGTPEENARALKALLNGDKSAYRDVVLLNSAAGLMIADKCESLKEGVVLAVEAIDSGAAMSKLIALVARTRPQ